MDTRIKALWLEALRSGEFCQTRGALRDTEGYCCLGVLTELYIREHPSNTWERTNQSVSGFLFNGDEGGWLPLVVKEWAGLPSIDPAVEFPGGLDGWDYVALSTLNDTRRQTFNEIADFIEQHF